MKKNLLALLAAGVLLLCACAFEKETVNDFKEPEIDVSSEIVLTGMPDIEKLLESEVVNAATGEKKALSELDSFEDHQTFPLRYSVVDLDADGENEYFIEYSDYGNTAIVRFFEGELYAYLIPFRARQNLKTDGEMQWSGGASYNGTQRAKFSGKKMEMVITLESDFDQGFHYIDGKEVSFDEASKAWDKFDAKENADWFYIYDIPKQ